MVRGSEEFREEARVKNKKRKKGISTDDARKYYERQWTLANLEQLKLLHRSGDRI